MAICYNIRMESFLKFLPVAHRGLHDAQFPENSLAAFRTAAEAGYAIETDVRFTKDRALVLFHDDTLLRMTGDRRAVSDCTLEELSALRLGGTDERVPVFSELLSLADGKVPLLIEIKNMAGIKGDEIARAMLAEIQASGFRGEYAVQSFQPMYVKAYKKLCPNVPCGVLGTADSKKADFGGSMLWRIKAAVIRNLLLNFTVKPDFVSYRLQDFPRKCVTRFRGIRLAWVVSSEEQESQARKMVDNIIFEGYRPARPSRHDAP